MHRIVSTSRIALSAVSVVLSVTIAGQAAAAKRAEPAPPAKAEAKPVTRPRQATAAPTPAPARKATAKDTKSAKPSSVQPAPSNLLPPIAWNGLRVAIDPVTGEFTMPESGELGTSAVVSDGRENLPVIEGADGSKSVVLPESMMDFAVVSFAQDGTAHFDCVQGLENANRAVVQAKPAKRRANPLAKPEVK